MSSRKLQLIGFVGGVQAVLSVLRSATFARVSWLIVALSLAAPGHAQNVVTNPNFDTVLAPWAQYLSADPDPIGAGSAPTWVASPNINGGASGSALVDIKPSPTTPDATNAASGISQCVNFAPVNVNFLTYGGSFFVPAATTADSNISANIEIRLFSAANCSGFITGGTQGQTFVTGINNATWFSLSDTNFSPPGPLPVSVASAEIRGVLRQETATLAQNDYKANFDKFFLVFNSTTPVRLQTFSVE